MLPPRSFEYLAILRNNFTNIKIFKQASSHLFLLAKIKAESRNTLDIQIPILD
jgi:hypothetical protein